MDEDPYVVFLVSAFAIMVSMVLVWFVIVSKYFSYIRDNHPTLYKELGEPTVLASDDAASDISFVRYIFGKRYMDSGDQRLIAKSLMIRKLVYIYAVVFLSFVIALISLGTT